MSSIKPRLHFRASLTEEDVVYKLRNSGLTSFAVDSDGSQSTDDHLDAQEHPGSDEAVLQLCSCDFTKVTDEGKRPALPIKPGDVAKTLRPLLSALKPLIPEDVARAEWDKERGGGAPRTGSRPSTAKTVLTRSSAASAPSLHFQTPRAPDSASPSSRPISGTSVQSNRSYIGKLRPCVVWRADPRKPHAEVFLMGTFNGTPYSGLPIVVRDYFLTVYTENGGDLRNKGYADVAHIHTSPCWTTPTTAWLIPLLVAIPHEELETHHESTVNINGEEEKLCTFVNNNSMHQLESYHNMALLHFSSAMKTEKSRKKVARKLFDQTKILDLFEADFENRNTGQSKADAATSWRSKKGSVRGKLGDLFGLKRPDTDPKSTTSSEAAPSSPLRQSASTHHPPEIVFSSHRSEIDDLKSWRRGTSSPLDATPPPPATSSGDRTHLGPPPAKPESRQSSGKRTSSFSSVRSAFRSLTSKGRSSTPSTRSPANTEDPSQSKGSLRDQGV